MGQFHFSASAPRWAWSDDMFVLHGMSPGDVVPTRALFLSHVQPDDRARVDLALDACAIDRRPMCCHYRLVDLAGEARDVTLALAPQDGGQDGGVRGFLIDDSERERQAVAQGVNAELHRALESHAIIDQAKGVLMFVYGVEPEIAFQLLRGASQERNVRLRTIAEGLVTSVQFAGGLGPQTRASMDELFMAILDGGLPRHQPEHRAPLELSVVRSGATPTLRVAGPVDLSSMAQLAAALSQLLATAGASGDVAVDLRGVDHLGRVTRAVVAAARRRCEAKGISMHIILNEPRGTSSAAQLLDRGRAEPATSGSGGGR